MKSIKKFVTKIIKIMSVVTVFTAIMFVGYKTREFTIEPKVVFADREVQVEVQKKAEVMERIAKCESGGKQFDKKGNVIMKKNANNSWDVGKYQINEAVWGPTAAKMQVNIFTEEGNEKFAYSLYEKYGTEPWVWSKPCWNK